MFGHNSAPDWVRNPTGWIAISRDIRNHPLVGFGQNVPPADPTRGSASRNEAWQDLIMMAAFKPQAVVNRGRETMLDVGQLVGSRSWLANRWNWSEKTVRWFLHSLSADGMVTCSNLLHEQVAAEIGAKQGPATGPAPRPAQGPANRAPDRNACNVITICNYRDYQFLSDEIEIYLDGLKGQQQGQQKGQHKGHNITIEQDSISKTEQEETVSGTSPDKGGKAAKKRAEYTLDFVAFWADYPRKDGTSKAEAAKAWAKLTAEEKRLAAARLPAFRRHEDERMRRSPGSTGLHASTYLNQKRWETLGDATDQAASYWWQKPEKLASVKHEQWVALVKKWANGSWPREKLGYPPASKHKVVLDSVIDELDLHRYYDAVGDAKKDVRAPWWPEGSH